MVVFAIGFFFLIMGSSSAVFAQSALGVRQDSYDAAWVRVDLSGDTPVSATAVDGLLILAQNVKDAAPSGKAVGRDREGIGAAGAQASAPAIKAETGYDPVQNSSEKLVLLFDQAVERAELVLTYFYRNEAVLAGFDYHEQGEWRAYQGNVLAGQGLFLPDSPNGEYRLTIRARIPFDRLEMSATPYVTQSGQNIEPGLILTDSSDYLIKHLAYRPVDGAHASAAD